MGLEPERIDVWTKIGGWVVAFLTFLLGAHTGFRNRREAEMERKAKLRRASDDRIQNIEYRLMRVEEGLPYIKASIDETKSMVREMRDSVMRPCNVCRVRENGEGR